MCMASSPVADPGFLVGGGGNLNSRCAYFPKKLYVEMKESEPLGGARRRRPLGSDNGQLSWWHPQIEITINVAEKIQIPGLNFGNWVGTKSLRQLSKHGPNFVKRLSNTFAHEKPPRIVFKRTQSRFSEIPCLNSLICLILLKSWLFTPNTSDRAQHMPNLKYSKIK